MARVSIPVLARQLIKSRKELSPKEKAQLLSGTAREFLGLTG
jgi:hypothetical protein